MLTALLRAAVLDPGLVRRFEAEQTRKAEKHARSPSAANGGEPVAKLAKKNEITLGSRATCALCLQSLPLRLNGTLRKHDCVPGASIRGEGIY